MYGQAQDREIRNVHEDVILYDTFRIGNSNFISAPLQGQNTFAAVAALDYIPFLNARTSAEAGLAYCNIDSKDKLAYPLELESIGIRFIYPNPYLSDLTPNGQAAAKIWQEVIPDHSWFEFGIREDMRLRAKPSMLPPGYGPSGMAMWTQWMNASYLSVEGQGIASMGNRWRWLDAQNRPNIRIPENSPIWARLYLSLYAKRLLASLQLWEFDLIEGIDLGTAETTPNECAIEVTLRGVRYLQQRGDYYK